MGGGNEQFISVETLYSSINTLEDKLQKMTAECEKLLQFNTDIVAENNQLKTLLKQRDTSLDIARTELQLVRDANKHLVIAVTETVRGL